MGYSLGDFGTDVKEFFVGKPEKIFTQPASPEQEAAAKQFYSGFPTLQTMAGYGQDAQENAVKTLSERSPNQVALEYFRSMPGGQVSGYTGAPITAQTQFNIRGAPSYDQVAYNRPGELGSALSGLQGFRVGQPVTDAQNQLNATYGSLGQFVQGAGSGQSAATLAASAAMDKQQEIAMQNALGQLKEKGFTGAATAGGMGNLAAMAAAQSAGDFARQKAGLLENERQAALQAAGLQGQFAGTLGNLSLGASGQQLQALQSMGSLAQGEAGQQLQASMANQDAALKAGQLAQQGDIAGAELALKGTGMNMDQAMEISRQNQAGQQANIGFGMDAQRLNLGAIQAAAGLTADQQRAMAQIQAASPDMAAIQQYLQFGQLLQPYQSMGSQQKYTGLEALGQTVNVVGDVMKGTGKYPTGGAGKAPVPGGFRG